MYSVVSNGITMVNGINKLTLEMSEPQMNKTYGISDYTVNIKESGIAYIPMNGSMKAQMDTIAEDKGYIDKMANIAGFLLTTFNTVHQQGAGIDGTDSSLGDDNGTATYKGPSYGRNFWGDDNTLYTWDAANQCVQATQMKDIKRRLTYAEKTDANGKALTDTDGNVIYMPQVTITGTKVDTGNNLKGINIINALQVNTAITAVGGQSLIAARTLSVVQATDDNGKFKTDASGKPVYDVTVNGSGDGTNATNVASLVNMGQYNGEKDSSVNNTSYQAYSRGNVISSAYVAYQESGATTFLMNMKDKKAENNMTSRSLDTNSVNAYYSAAVSQLGSDSESLDDKADAQDDLILQITNWRSSTSGVDWNEELSNMIMFQKGYSACSRCLTTMDEMLDKLINSTGMVGR